MFGTAAAGTTDLYHADLRGPAAIVIGSEGDGMTRLAMENCDFLVSIPMRGKLNFPQCFRCGGPFCSMRRYASGLTEKGQADDPQGRENAV